MAQAEEGVGCRMPNIGLGGIARAGVATLLAGFTLALAAAAAASAATLPSASGAAAAAAGPAADPASVPKGFLILSGAQYGLPANDLAVAGIVGRLKERGVGLNQIYFESLDLARIPAPDYPQQLREFLRGKLRAANPGAVIVVSQPGMRFIADAGSDIVAPDLPVVTALVSQPDVSWKGAPRPTVAIPDRVDAAGTLRSALAVFPGTQRIVVVAGREDVQRPYLAAARKALAELPRRLEVEFTSGLSYEDMLRRVASLPPASLVLYSPYFQDVTGRSFVAAEVAATVGRSATAPVFAMFETHLVPGVVGGSVVDLRSVGRKAADEAFDIVRGGKRVAPGITEVPVAPVQVFDWREVER